MLYEDILLRPFQSLKVDRNHMKLNLNEPLQLSPLESVFNDIYMVFCFSIDHVDDVLNLYVDVDVYMLGHVNFGC